MSLSTEDVLRLNVLLANNIEAIRIDEQNMTVHGLAQGQEARVPLNPNCRPEKYLKLVREMLSSHVLGSPGGYPVFLQRWTRMGQARETRLDKLLLLGEPEAVTAVAGAAGLTDDLARRTWWVQPTSDIARRLLEKKAVVQGSMGKTLADFLAEHLPFESDPMLVVATIRLLLQPGLIEESVRERIFRLGTHRNAYHIGFLEAVPDDLPEAVAPRDDLERFRDSLSTLATQGNTLAALLMKLLDRPGQTFLTVSEVQLQHPIDKYTVAKMMDIVGRYFDVARGEQSAARDLQTAQAQVAEWLSNPDHASADVLRAAPELRPEIEAMLLLAHSGEALVTPIIAASTASGTLLRRKLEPVLHPLLQQYATLRKGAPAPAKRPSSRRQPSS